MKTQHANRSHALLSPSSFERLMHCPGSLKMSEGIPPAPPSEFAAEGTLAHEKIQELIQNAILYPKELSRFVNAIDFPNEEMKHCVTGYIEFILSLERVFLAEKKGLVERYIERRVSVTSQIWGTLDYGAVYENMDGTFDVVVCDFKYGRGVDVDAVDNPQLILYAIGMAREVKKLSRVHLYIYQPRTPGSPVSKDILTSRQLKQWEKKLVAIGDEAIDMLKGVYEFPIVLRAGNHCRFCPAHANCPTRKESIETAMVAHLDPIDFSPEVSKLTTAQKVRIFEVKKQVEHFLDAIELDILGMLNRGEKVPGYKLVEGRSVRQWKDEELVASKLQAAQIDPWQKKLITITEAERKIGKEAVDSLTVKSVPKLQVAPVSDKRPAVRPDSEALNLIEAIEENGN